MGKRSKKPSTPSSDQAEENSRLKREDEEARARVELALAEARVKRADARLKEAEAGLKEAQIPSARATAWGPYAVAIITALGTVVGPVLGKGAEKPNSTPIEIRLNRDRDIEPDREKGLPGLDRKPDQVRDFISDVLFARKADIEGGMPIAEAQKLVIERLSQFEALLDDPVGRLQVEGAIALISKELRDWESGDFWTNRRIW